MDRDRQPSRRHPDVDHPLRSAGRGRCRPSRRHHPADSPSPQPARAAPLGRSPSRRARHLATAAAPPLTTRSTSYADGCEPPGPCSFCGRSYDVCAKLIAGLGVFICQRCVVQATRLSAGAAVERQVEGPMRLEPPGSEAPPVQLLRPGGPEGAAPGRQRAVGGCGQVRRAAPDLRQVPGPLPGDPGRDLACLSRARWAAGTTLGGNPGGLSLPSKAAPAEGRPRTRTRRWINRAKRTARRGGTTP